MTEADWLAATDVQPMLEYLQPDGRERKTRLLKCAYCRLVWHLLIHSNSRRGVEVAELFADGDASLVELNTAIRDTDHAVARVHRSSCGGPHDPAYAIHTAADAASITTSNTGLITLGVARSIATAAGAEAEAAGRHRAYSREGKVKYQAAKGHALSNMAGLTRCIVGNPFRPIAFDQTWRTETAVTLATSIYTERAFDRMPILADALQDAGCDHDDMLNHCRGDGPHARGCWVVDLVLGKE